MKLRKVDTYKISVLATIGLLYLLVVDQYQWLQLALFGVIVLERALVAFILWFANRMRREMAKQLMDAIMEAKASGEPIIGPPFDQEEEL